MMQNQEVQLFEGEIRVDMRHVCPKDVKKILLQRARTVYWKLKN